MIGPGQRVAEGPVEATPPHDADRPWPVRDLHEVIDLALARGADLLTAGERIVVGRIRALDGDAAVLFARLTTRVGGVFALDGLRAAGVADVPGAVHVLEREGLVDRLVSCDAALDVASVADLQAGCARRGLSARGRRDALVERLRGTRWTDRPHVRVRHRALLRRLEQWAFLDRRPDRARLVVDRLGLLRYPEYTLTGEGGLHRDRRALLAWEALWAERDTLPPEALVAALDRRRWPPARLDLRGSVVRRVIAAARAREATDPAGARALYRALQERGLDDGSLAVRVARTLETEGDPCAALDVLHAARAGSSRLAVARAGRRVARVARRGWAPDPPLRRPPVRDLVIPGAPPAGRPRYATAHGEAVVEAAVASVLAVAGRRCVRGEGPLWTTVFALLFAETYFLPVPGMLPVRFLDGPIDVGTPAFAGRRRAAVEAVLAAVDRGEAPERLLRADGALRGTWLAGAAWGQASGEELAAVARGVGPQGLRCVLGRLLAEGFGAAAGLPDLVVLPGPETRLAAHPSRVPAGAMLVEVKGPTDAVRDEQRVWFDHLLRAGVRVELWQVAPSPEAQVPGT